MEGHLSGKSALVFGTSPNIGAGIALALAEAGARVASADRDRSNADDCAGEIVKLGGNSVGIVCDVSSEAAVRAAFDRVRREFGGVDILVNGAAYFNTQGILDMPLDEWSAQLSVILGGAFLCTKYAVAHMIEGGRRGSIINIISTEGHQGSPGNIAYATAKAGLLNFTRAVAMEVAKFGIRVNSVTPTATDPHEGWERAGQWGRDVAGAMAERESVFEALAAKTPLGVLPSPKHYGAAVAFLCSDSAEMITGFDLCVDSGNLARYWRWNPWEQPFSELAAKATAFVSGSR